MPRMLKLSLATLALATLAACGSDSDPATVASDSTTAGAVVAAETKNDAVAVAQAEPALSLLVEAVAEAGLADTLSGPGPFTILAPTNDAFLALLAELGVTKDQLFADKALLGAVLQYHVVAGQVARADIPLGAPVSSVQGGVFTITESPSGALSVNDGRGRTAGIVATDVPADNAVIHLLDTVILPPEQTVVGIAQSNPAFSTLVQAVIAAGLVDTLSGDGPFTVFAPTDEAFAALLSELGVSADELLGNTELLTQVLTYHVVPGLVTKAGVPVDTPVGTVQGETFSVDPSLAITDGQGRRAQIVATDVLATNGVVHVIDAVILPASLEIAPPAPAAPSLVEIASGDARFSILVEAVVAAGLVDALSEPGPFTVFAPTNDAFEALLHELHVSKHELFADVHALREVLLYHVLAGQVLAADVPFDTHIATLQGGAFSIDAHLRIRDALHRHAGIVSTDVIGANGVIHVIDRVLLPH